MPIPRKQSADSRLRVSWPINPTIQLLCAEQSHIPGGLSRSITGNCKDKEIGMGCTSEIKNKPPEYNPSRHPGGETARWTATNEQLDEYYIRLDDPRHVGADQLSADQRTATMFDTESLPKYFKLL